MYKFETAPTKPFIDIDGSIPWVDRFVELAEGYVAIYAFHTGNDSDMPDSIGVFTPDSECISAELKPCREVVDFLENIEQYSAIELLTLFREYRI